MLICEGYKMFKGSAKFTPRRTGAEPKKFSGTWLYNPEFAMWFVNNCPDLPFGSSFPASQISDIQEDT